MFIADYVCHWKKRIGDVNENNVPCFDYYTHIKSISESSLIRPNLDCNYAYPIDCAQNEIPFDAKLLGKVQFKYGLI